MICIKCFHAKTTIANSRGHKRQPLTWRRHTCPRCHTTFTTHEQPVLEQAQVLNMSGKVVPFNLGRLTISIARSFQHDVTAGKHSSYSLAQTVQQTLTPQLAAERPLTTSNIAAATLTVLERYDRAAALQYAAQHGLAIPRCRYRKTGSS